MRDLIEEMKEINSKMKFTGKNFYVFKERNKLKRSLEN